MAELMIRSTASLPDEMDDSEQRAMMDAADEELDGAVLTDLMSEMDEILKDEMNTDPIPDM